MSAPAGSDLEILAARYGWSESIWELEQQGEDPFKDGWKDCMDVVRPTHAAHASLASLKAEKDPAQALRLRSRSLSIKESRH